MRVTTELVLSDEDIAACYPVHERAWQPLLTRAAARQLLAEEEFRKEMADPRIEQVLLRDDGEPIAMTTLTTDPSVVDWTDPDFDGPGTAMPSSGMRRSISDTRWSTVRAAGRTPWS